MTLIDPTSPEREPVGVHPTAIVYGAPLQIAPQPVPVMISCTPVAVGLEQAVVMQVQTVTGTQMYFLPADLAKQVSRHLNAAAQGIVLAS